MLSSVLSGIQSMIFGTNLDDANGEERLAAEEYNPSMDDIRQVRTLLRHFVPIELADIILHQAEYYHVVSASVERPLTIVDQRSHRADVPILSLTFHDPGDEDLLSSILRVSLVIEGHDQGWSGFPEDKGTTNNSWTWYSIGTADSHTHEERLATNLHAVRDTQTHSFDWDRDSDIVQMIRNERMIQVWAHARFPGWVNHVQRAELSIISFPSSSSSS